MAPNYLQNYVQSIFNGIGGVQGKTLVLGGDGRFFNAEAIQIILKMAAANGVKKMIVGQDGLLSTPAASHLIRLNETDGGLILSASHNPGGEDADFGLKYNMPNGGPAVSTVTDRIFAETQSISEYFQVDEPDIDLTKIAKKQVGEMLVDIVSATTDYVSLMRQLFDFKSIHALFASGFTMKFDAMHAVTGPYAKAIFEEQLGAPKGTVLNGLPSPDFGGGHPDPNPVWARELMEIMHAEDAPDFGAASDGDGDRNMIVGKKLYVSPSDSIAVLADHAECVPAFFDGLIGVARSMPTSAAVDRVAAAKGLSCFETPTGWKFFGNLLDDDKVRLCGEESAGTGGNHVREKDGIWAVLFWLNILAKTNISVPELMLDHWEKFGRNYYTRHDYEAVEKGIAEQIIEDLRSKLSVLSGTEHAGISISTADEFSYHDPVDKSHATAQGIRILFRDGSRIVFRLSGTGTEGATIRVYLEKHEANSEMLTQDPQSALAHVIAAAEELSGIKARTGRAGPDVVT